MSSAAPVVRPATERFSAKSFAAFRLDPERPGRAGPILPLAAQTLEEAVNDAKTRCIHKEVLAIREADELTGETRVHLFEVKQKSRPTYVWQGHRQVAVRELYVEPVCVLPAEVLAA